MWILGLRVLGLRCESLPLFLGRLKSIVWYDNNKHSNNNHRNNNDNNKFKYNIGCTYSLNIYTYIYTIIICYPIWLRRNGVDTDGAAAKVMNFDRLGDSKIRPGTFGKIKVSCDVVILGSFPIRWLLFDLCYFKYNHLMRKMIDDDHITWYIKFVWSYSRPVSDASFPSSRAQPSEISHEHVPLPMKIRVPGPPSPEKVLRGGILWSKLVLTVCYMIWISLYTTEIIWYGSQ